MWNLFSQYKSKLPLLNSILGKEMYIPGTLLYSRIFWIQTALCDAQLTKRQDSKEYRI